MRDQIVRALQEALEDHVDTALSKLEAANLCESPIEAAIAIVLLYNIRMSGLSCELVYQDNIDLYPKNIALIVPQYRFEGYRIDFAFILAGKMLFIECDGHDFHERTKEQAARDRKKDRSIQQAGIRILRFTGSEIYRDVTSCATQILDSFNTLPARAVTKDADNPAAGDAE